MSGKSRPTGTKRTTDYTDDERVMNIIAFPFGMSRGFDRSQSYFPCNPFQSVKSVVKNAAATHCFAHYRETHCFQCVALSSTLLLLLLFPAVLAAPKDKAKDPAWAVESAPYRVLLHATAPPDAAAAGWEIRLPDFGAGRADMRDAVLLGPDRKEIPLDPVWRGAGRTLLLLAETMPANGAAATLYFGGNTQRRLRSWTAQRSLLLETRRTPEGANVATYAAWQAAWNQSHEVDGAAFVPQIFHGENPFGESQHFMSRYTGLLQTGNGGDMKFYTLSHDVSYVMIDGHAAAQWQSNTPPPLAPEKVPTTTVRVPPGTARVEYFHAVADPPAAMVLGWEQAGKLGNVPPEAWVHPGKVSAAVIEARDATPVPLATLTAERYLGFGGEWYVIVRGSLTKPADGWEVEWQWPDKKQAVDLGPDVRRLWMSLDPLPVILRLRNGQRVIEGRCVLVIAHNLEAASINNERQLAQFTGLLNSEDPNKLPEPARRAGFALASAFLPTAAALRWTEPWLTTAKPGGELWVGAMTLAIREAAKLDPRAALRRLHDLSKPELAALGRMASMLELDLLVFGLQDAAALGLVERLRKGGDKTLATLATIRLGDYQLLNGRIEEAARCYSEAVPGSAAGAGKAPVIDRAYSLAIEDLINGNHLDEARAKLDAWELQRPTAKLDADQLLWRARVMFLAGEWQRALQDLQTCLKLRPGSPEEIDVRFWQARTLFELGRKDQARIIFNALVKDYPKHERAEAAKLWAAKP
ncbi:MAG: tetratricopeptide repeat protein [Verrucomicrobia bacterium]|nr:MAG: tetratricopeptide repeat protein [Verrucomicrobiota bacterium]